VKDTGGHGQLLENALKELSTPGRERLRVWELFFNFSWNVEISWVSLTVGVLLQARPPPPSYLDYAQQKWKPVFS